MRNGHDVFPSRVLPLCLACQRLRLDRQGHWTCAAFPGGISQEFLDSEIDHRLPYPGDQGIRFEPDWGAPEAVVSLMMTALGAAHDGIPTLTIGPE
jgi:hypothetical protein